MLSYIDNFGGERGIRTLEGLLTLTPLAGVRLRPLGHLSAHWEMLLCQPAAPAAFRPPPPRGAAMILKRFAGGKEGSDPVLARRSALRPRVVRARTPAPTGAPHRRSEERRVGKERRTGEAQGG